MMFLVCVITLRSANLHPKARRISLLCVRPVEFGGCTCAHALLLDQGAKHDKQHGSGTQRLSLLVLLLRRKDDSKELEKYFLLKILG